MLSVESIKYRVARLEVLNFCDFGGIFGRKKNNGKSSMPEFLQIKFLTD